MALPVIDTQIDGSELNPNRFFFCYQIITIYDLVRNKLLRKPLNFPKLNVWMSHFLCLDSEVVKGFSYDISDRYFYSLAAISP